MRRFGSIPLLVAALGLTGTGAAAAAPADGTASHYAASVSFTMQSMPDFLNADTADLSTAKFWQPGDPNGINDTYRASLGTVLDDVRANSAGTSTMLIPGDTVEGHWGLDRAGTGIFGPVDTEATMQAAVVRASGRYYSQYKQRFASRGYTLHAAVGDHEIGDNNWGDASPYEQFKRRNLTLFKNQWAKYFTASGTRYADHPVGTNFDRTAYATMLSPDVLLVTVDMFTRTSTNVLNQLGSGELTWLDRTLATARANGVRWIVVQGHDPVLGPVRYRHSSRQMYRGGQSSAFWQTMRTYGVNLYLCGEVHDTTAIVPDDGGPVQISHGGLFYLGQVGYLTSTFTGNTLSLAYRDFPGATSSTADGYLWQTDRDRLIPAIVSYPQASTVSATMTLTSDHTVLERTGLFQPYTPTTVQQQAMAQRNALSPEVSGR